MAALRFLSMLLLLIAVVVLAVDLTRPQTAGETSFIPLARHWSELSPASFAGARRSAQGWHPALWDGLIAPVLSLPGWLSFGALGILSGYLGRHRRRINIFTN